MNIDLFGISGLALGGAVAAVAAFWQQFRNALRQLSSVLILQTSVNTSIHNAVIHNLKDNYWKLPSGIKQVRGIWMPFRDKTEKLVPFSVLPPTSIWFGKGRMVLVTIGDTGSKLISIRGLCNIDKLIVESLSDFEAEINSNVATQNRYKVEVLIGCEKGPWAARTNRGENEATTRDSPTAITGVGSDSDIDVKRDRSLCYRKEDYNIASLVDPLEGLFYDQEVLNYLEEARRWKASQRWYQERSIPWKRGWLVHGPGGTGKSSLAQVVAKSIGVPLYNFVLSTMSDQEFISNMQGRINPPCVVLFEDFDTVFDKRTPMTEHKSLTFDCVLNQISGVKTLNGVFLIVTTNHIDKIDEALGVVSSFGSISTRPGRIDQVIYLGPTSETVRKGIASSILKDWPETVDDLVVRGEGTTAVQFQEMCIQTAFTLINTRAL